MYLHQIGVTLSHLGQAYISICSVILRLYPPSCAKNNWRSLRAMRDSVTL